MFVSTYESAIDAKGRISVPAPFRSVLGEKARIYVYPAIDGTACLEGCGEELMAVYRQVTSRMSLQDPARVALVHAIYTKSVERKLDETGRISLPADMLAQVGITTHMTFAGALDRFRIWNPENYKAFDEKMTAAAAASQDKLDAPFQAALAAGSLPGLIPGKAGER